MLQFLFQHHHGKHAGTGRNITRTDRNAVGGSHSGSRIPLWRTHGNTGFQVTGHVQQPGPFLRQYARILSGHQGLWKDVPQFPWKMLPCHQFIKLVNPLLVKILCMDVHREHACHIADPKDPFPGQHPVYITLQCNEIINILYMLLLIQDGLVQVGNAPSLGHIVPENPSQLLRSRPCDGIPPCAEGNQELPILIKRHVTVHHGGKTDGTNGGKGHAVRFLHVGRHLRITVPDTIPYVIQGIGPDMVHIQVFPVMASGGNGGMVLPDEHCLNPGGTQFNSQRRIPFFNSFLNCIII